MESFDVWIAHRQVSSCKTTLQLDRFSVKCTVMESFDVWIAHRQVSSCKTTLQLDRFSVKCTVMESFDVWIAHRQPKLQLWGDRISGGIIRVCMGIFTTALRKKTIRQILNKNTSPYFHSVSLVIWPLTLMKRAHFKFLTYIRKA